jgi:DegV family protein with EDD domain
MAKVALVTDSTATISADLCKKYNIHAASQVVIWDEKTYKDGVDIQPKEFYARLSTSKTMPSTSQVAMVDFKNLYEKLHAEGYDILTVVLSQQLSQTYNSANQAAGMIDGANIEVIDSRSVAMGLGFNVLKAAKAAADGASLADCKQLVEESLPKAGVIITPETLEYLHRGGRIGGGARFLGTALRMNPILELVDGRLEPVERVRTRKKTLKRLVQLAGERIGGRTPLALSVVHANAEEEAKMLMETCKATFSPEELSLNPVSPSIGTHTGPGTIGLAWLAG